METLTAQISNVMQAIFLTGMIIGALVRLTDGRRELLWERIGLFLVACGAFFQLVKAAHPSGTEFEILVTHAGSMIWLLSQAYALYRKGHILKNVWFRKYDK